MPLGGASQLRAVSATTPTMVTGRLLIARDAARRCADRIAKRWRHTFSRDDCDRRLAGRAAIAASNRRPTMRAIQSFDAERNCRRRRARELPAESSSPMSAGK